MAEPLVSCIMPTRDRRAFVRMAIRHFLVQDYPNLELIVLDDGRDCVADLVPADGRIHYRRLEREISLGAKRNLACELAQGEFIAHLDDDDWMAPHRISTQVAALRRSGKEVCGLSGVMHYQPWSRLAWQFHETSGEVPYITGGTLVYRRDAVQAHKFPATLPAPTRRFVASFPPGAKEVVHDPSLYVALLHPANTSPKNLSDPHWHAASLVDLANIVADDRRAFDRLTSSWSSPTRAQRAGTDLTLAAPFLIYDGYGSMAQYLALGMQRAGATVHPYPLRLDPAGLSPDLLELLRRSRPDLRGTVLCFAPGPDASRFQSSSDLFVNTMWETSRLPVNWPQTLNTVRAVMVPSRYVADVFRRSGVSVPIEVVPQGVDPAIYTWQERPLHAGGPTTLMVGPVCARKHTHIGIEAWKRAFADEPDARLILKARWQYANYVPDDPRISFVDANETTLGIAHWYRQADVLLALGNEGFGLPLVEGMASGLPVIALNSEGQADICREARDLVLPVTPERWEPFDEQPFGACGVRAVPNIDQVEEHLRWVAHHPTEARALGAAASGWALDHRNVWEMGPGMLDVIEHRSRPPRSLRHGRALWAPRAARNGDGIDAYTRRLAAALHGVKISQDVPDIADSRLVHIQYAREAVPPAQLDELADQARRACIPVVLTLHEVQATLDAAELQADVLVTTTQLARDLVAKRWPGRRVEHVPYGCSTWFPIRKRSRGRVVAVWSSLEEQDAWHVLEATSVLPDVEVLVVAPRSTATLERCWRRRIARHGRVRRIVEPAAPANAAATIAAQADVLVYWSRPRSELVRACGVRDGLATGVPVLMSSDAAPPDLAEVTYQATSLQRGLIDLFDNPDLGQRLCRAAREHCFNYSWHRIGERHLALWRSLEHP